jgi:hypothetical protein
VAARRVTSRAPLRELRGSLIDLHGPGAVSTGFRSISSPVTGGQARAHEWGEAVGGSFCRSQGQALILTALIMPLLLGLTALGVDASSLFVQKRAIQNAADSAALAAGDELGPASDPACQASLPCLAIIDTKVAAVAASYSRTNGGSDTLSKCVVSTDTNCYT